ncbi:MAG: hypothetical protein ACTHM5_14730 [Ginsengibacter sp.]
MEVFRYSKKYEQEWNNFVSQGKNATFLFNRSFMEYHSDRFNDYSLMVTDAGKIVSVVPANVTGSTIVSHEGLTYGGFVLSQNVKLKRVIEVICLVLQYYNNNGLELFELKNFPQFYNCSPTSEIDYCLFLLNATLFRRDIAFAVDNRFRINYSGNIRREANKAHKKGAIFKEEKDFGDFWKQLLIPGLMEKYGVNPVHSLKEIEQLRSCFPDQIKQYSVHLSDEIVAGTTLFLTPYVAHCQYIASSETGRKSGALNYLFQQLLDVTCSHLHYFDFGIVNEQNGRLLNNGMLFWKESFGGRSHSHDFYRIETKNFSILKDYF